MIDEYHTNKEVRETRNRDLDQILQARDVIDDIWNKVTAEFSRSQKERWIIKTRKYYSDLEKGNPGGGIYNQAEAYRIAYESLI